MSMDMDRLLTLIFFLIFPKLFPLYPRYVAIFFPMRHLRLEYRRALILGVAASWLFSLAMGAWQGGVHHAGPSTR